jgi:Cys-tRNA(Pro) deacylase
MSTRGIRFLEARGLSFETVTYVYKRKGAGRAAAAVGWNEDQVVKSLVACTSDRAFLFVLVPASRDLSTKKLARHLGVKSVDMAAVREAERMTGYSEGGISPFGSYAEIPAVMDESLLEHETVLINAGRRGVLVSMSPWDIQELLDAAVEDVVT